MTAIVSHPGYYLVTLDAEGEPDYDINGEPVISGSLVELPRSPGISMKISGVRPLYEPAGTPDGVPAQEPIKKKPLVALVASAALPKAMFPSLSMVIRSELDSTLPLVQKRRSAAAPVSWALMVSPPGPMDRISPLSTMPTLLPTVPT